MESTLDKIDYKIIKILHENSRLSYADIGRKIMLSPSATRERVQNLLDMGVIKHFGVAIDYKKLGFGLKVIIHLKFKNYDFKRFIEDLHKFPEIISCKRITGEFCMFTECILKDSTHLQNLIDRIIPYGIPTTSIELADESTNNFFEQNFL